MKKLFENFRRFVNEKEIKERAEHMGWSGKCVKDGIEGYIDANGVCITKEAEAKRENLKETENKEQTKEELLQSLQELLEKWPACDPKEGDPDGMACQYHKDLEEVVKDYGGTGCGPGAHGSDVTGPGEGRVISTGAAAQYIDES